MNVNEGLCSVNCYKCLSINGLYYKRFLGELSASLRVVQWAYEWAAFVNFKPYINHKKSTHYHNFSLNLSLLFFTSWLPLVDSPLSPLLFLGLFCLKEATVVIVAEKSRPKVLI